MDATSDHNIDVAGETKTPGTFGVAGGNTINAVTVGPRGGMDAFVAQLSNAGQVNQVVILGGSADDSATGVAVDQNGNAYITGWSNNPSDNQFFFPTTNGAFQTTNAGSTDTFASKIIWAGAGGNPALGYSTLFGATASSTYGYGIVLNTADDSVYIVGKTDSDAAFGVANKLNYAVIGQNKGTDAFVAYFDPNGNPNVANPYFVVLGGTRTDIGFGIASTKQIGGSLKLYISGTTNSNNKPVPGGNGFPTPGTLQPYRGNVRAQYNAFVALLDPTKAPANSLLWNTYIGGLGSEAGLGVAADGSGNAYVVGYTSARNFRPPGNPPVPGFQTTYGGGNSDGFVVEIAPNLAAAAAPQLAPIGNQTALVDSLLTFTASAQTFDGSSPYYSLDGAPSGASIDPNSGVFTWTPTPAQIGTWTFSLDASDAEDDFDEQTITVSVVPQFTFTSVSSSANPSAPGQSVTFTATVMPQASGTWEFSEQFQGADHVSALPALVSREHLGPVVAWHGSIGF